MRWRRRSQEQEQPGADPVVLTVSTPVTGDTADALATQIDRIAARSQRVVIDLTAIPAFDSDGATRLLTLQERIGTDRVTIVGMRQAAARLLGPEAEPPSVEREIGAGWHLHRLRNLAVVQLRDGESGTLEGLERALGDAIAEQVALVVLDLRGVESVSSAGLQAIAFASSSAAVNGQELLVVNVKPAVAERLRRAGLSATTFVAPEPILDEPYG